MSINPNYSLIPGTNQLILKHPDQGAQLFKRHGYDIKHPKYRDYYNALRHRQNGASFFNDLGSLLSGLSGVLGKSKTTPGTGFAPKIGTSTGSVGSSLSLMDTPIAATDVNPFAYEAYTGPMQSHHAHAYNELLKHLELQSIAEREGRIVPIPVGIPYGVGFPQPADTSGVSTISDPIPVPEGFFEQHKKLVITLGIALAVVLYIKFRK